MSGSRNDALIQLCQQLLPHDVSLVDEVKLAIEQPTHFAAQFRGNLSGRGIYEPRPSLPWIALIDGLIERNCCREIDWKEAPKDVMAAIDDLLPDQPHGPNRWTWVDLQTWDNSSTEDFLDVIAHHLHDEGKVLAYLDHDSDSFALIILEPSRFRESEYLARQAGYGELVPWSDGAVENP